MAAIRRRRDMYMTTGLKCVRTANVELVQERKMAAGTKLSAPTAELFGVQDPQGDLDIGVAYEREKSSREGVGFVAAGEQIYAIQYRKVRFRSFFKKSTDEAELENSVRWPTYLNRATGGEEEVVEVGSSDAEELLGLGMGMRRGS
jgi:hypothetical protein